MAPTASLDYNALSGSWATLSSSLHHLLRPSGRIEDFLAQTHRSRGNLDQLIVVDKAQGLLQIQRANRHQTQGLVRTGSPDVGEFLFSGHIHVQISRA